MRIARCHLTASLAPQGAMNRVPVPMGPGRRGHLRCQGSSGSPEGATHGWNI
jgi:hypothetical protein